MKNETIQPAENKEEEKSAAPALPWWAVLAVARRFAGGTSLRNSRPINYGGNCDDDLIRTHKLGKVFFNVSSGLH